MTARGSLILGIALVASAAWASGRDIQRGIQGWHGLGPLPPGIEAPAFRLFKLEGGTLSGEDLLGSVSVMTFWATWCGVCKGELDDLDELNEAYASRSDVKILAVNREGGGLSRDQVEASVHHYRKTRGLQLPIVLDDGSASQAFRVRPIPHTIVFDREGMIRHVHQGRVSGSTIRAEVDRLLAD